MMRNYENLGSMKGWGVNISTILTISWQYNIRADRQV